MPNEEVYLSRKLRVKRMRPRDPAEIFRSSSPLELFFDLIFAVSVSLASAQLVAAETHSDIGGGLLAYLIVFFAVWWAWMNFTWFASAFDADDWLYRVLALTQMAGVVVLAVGTTPAMANGDFRIIIAGYVVMRLALVAQWIRASRSHPTLKRTALRYAVGISLVQVLWICYPLVPAQFSMAVFFFLVLCEISVPLIAERAGQTPWHPEHIADRYGSFTLIVLGESVLASTTAAANAFENASQILQFALLGAGGFILAAGMWWVYFSSDASVWLQKRKAPMIFGYGHYFVFAAAGAYSAGSKVLIDHEAGNSGLTSTVAVATLTIPVAIFLLGVWGLILKHCLRGIYKWAFLVISLLIGSCLFLPYITPTTSTDVTIAVISVLSAAGLMVLLVVLIEASGVRDQQRPTA
ncbi:low temperature requirement protein A [Glutamicibacter sp.]|uniref:low temperature requirement protein A n=1 Tax=Glutamicibacter sp. TaxID=1931995 RepID=UPI0028BD94ED|nr:low temperature requirement protein A [Glutamicibacter sp.]